MSARLTQNVFVALLGLILLTPMIARAQSVSSAPAANAGSTDGGIAPDQDNPGFDARQLQNPLLPGIGFCVPLLNFFCEIDPRKTPVVSYGYKVLNYVLSFTGLFMVLVLIYGGARSLLAFGDAKAAEEGHKAIIAAIIGFILITLAYAVSVTILYIAKK